MEGFARYAVYWTPGPGALADFGAAWLGWDAGRGAPVPHPEVPGLPRPPAELTAEPRRYGLHATLKPPFRLAPGTTAAMLDAAVAGLARRLAPADVPEGLAPGRLGGFLALLPAGDEAALAAVAAAAVEALDPFRAAPGAAELARRRAAGLTPRQEALLKRWGYPYVMEEFRFHVTLTGRLAPAESEAVAAALGPLLAPLLPRPFRLEALSLMGEDADGRFRLVARHPLGGG
jgi:putative phosphonate metabolism protein